MLIERSFIIGIKSHFQMIFDLSAVLAATPIDAAETITENISNITLTKGEFFYGITRI